MYVSCIYIYIVMDIFDNTYLYIKYEYYILYIYVTKPSVTHTSPITVLLFIYMCKYHSTIEA